MPRNALKIALAAVAAATIAGCGLGDEGTIRQGDADALLSRLDAVETNVNSGSCDLANEQAGEFADAVAALPAEVDGEVKDGLRQAADRLVELTADDSECVDQQGATGETGAVPPPEEVETTTEEEPTTTETETTTEEEAEPEQPPEEETGPEEEEPPAEEEQLEQPGGSGGGIGPTGGVGGGGDE